MVEDLPEDPVVDGFDPLAELDEPDSADRQADDSSSTAAPKSTSAAGATVLNFQDYVFSDRMADWLLVYVGPNPKPYAATYRRMVKKRKIAIFSWSFAALFFTFAWFVYRRMWLLAAVLIGLPFLMANVAPVIFANVFAAAPLIGALMGKGFYLNRAFRQIYAIEQMAIDDAEKHELIRQAGGISIVGGILGGIAVMTGVGMLLIMLAALLGTSLPLAQ
ncbi:MAG: DUF2628 domain-containing protein [Pseudomonadota bacterium]